MLIYLLTGWEAQLMCIVGEDNLNWPSAGMVEQSIARLKAHGQDNYQVLSYPKAGRTSLGSCVCHVIP